MKKNLLLAHRGFPSKFTENTIQSFSHAIRLGVDGIECDVQKTRDGQFVIFHDFNLTRLTGINASINTVDFVEIKHLKLSGNSTIPLLQDLLSIIPENLLLNIELKQSIEISDLKNIYNILSSFIPKERLLISSFHHELLSFFIEKKIKTGMLIGYKHEEEGLFHIFFSILRIKPTHLNLPIQIFKKYFYPLPIMFLVLLRLCCLKLAFYTINTREEFTMCYKYADIIISDEIELIKTLIEKAESRSGKAFSHRWNISNAEQIQSK
jgi:glycerophosphoryl diester phosphodiesterase